MAGLFDDPNTYGMLSALGALGQTMQPSTLPKNTLGNLFQVAGAYGQGRQSAEQKMTADQLRQAQMQKLNTETARQKAQADQMEKFTQSMSVGKPAQQSQAYQPGPNEAQDDLNIAGMPGVAGAPAQAPAIPPQVAQLLMSMDPDKGTALIAKMMGLGVQEKFSNAPVWGTDEEGNPVLLQTSNRGGVKPVELPPGVTPQRGGTSKVDMGDRFGVLDANGTLIGYIPKGLPPKREITKDGVVELPAKPGGTSTPAAPSKYTTDIPGGGTRTQIPPSRKQQKGTAEAGVSGASATLSAIGNIRKLKKENPDTSLFGTASRVKGWMSGTPAGKARSYLRGITSGVALKAMTRLKEASASGATGFGAMNEKELDILISDMGSLNPDETDDEIMFQTLERIEGSYHRVLKDIEANVDPAILKETGLDKVIAEARGGEKEALKKKWGLD